MTSCHMFESPLRFFFFYLSGFLGQPIIKWEPGNVGNKGGCRDTDHIIHQVPVGQEKYGADTIYLVGFIAWKKSLVVHCFHMCHGVSGYSARKMI